MELILSEKSPTLGYGISVPVGDRIFVHGGIEIRTNDTSPPSNACHIFDCRKQIWIELTCPNSPRLSFHEAYVTANRFVHLVGGWNGKSRSSCVYIYDVQGSKWLQTCKTIGFPNGAGLSGHTVTPIENDGCLITGRLGGLQTQRRFGCVLTLRPIAFPNVFRYELISDAKIQSRSGHTCTPIKTKKRSCLLLGGRDQDVIELLQYDQLSIDHTAEPVEISESYHRVYLNKPPSRRYHITVPIFDKYGIGQAVLVHGGENFGSTAKGPSTQGSCAVILSTDPQKALVKSSGQNQAVYTLGQIEMPRLTGHKSVNMQGKIFILGGFTDDWRLNKHIYQLKL